MAPSGSLELEQAALQQPDDDERGGPGQLGHRSAHAPADLGRLGDALLGVVEAALAHGAHGVVQWVEDHRAGLAQGVGHVLDAGYLLVHGGHVAGLEQHRDAPVADDHLHLAVAQAPAQLEKLDAVAQLVGDRVGAPAGEQRAAEDVLERLGGGAILVGRVLLAGQRDGLVRQPERPLAFRRPVESHRQQSLHAGQHPAGRILAEALDRLLGQLHELVVHAEGQSPDAAGQGGAGQSVGVVEEAGDLGRLDEGATRLLGVARAGLGLAEGLQEGDAAVAAGALEGLQRSLVHGRRPRRRRTGPWRGRRPCSRSRPRAQGRRGERPRGNGGRAR